MGMARTMGAAHKRPTQVRCCSCTTECCACGARPPGSPGALFVPPPPPVMVVQPTPPVVQPPPPPVGGVPYVPGNLQQTPPPPAQGQDPGPKYVFVPDLPTQQPGSPPLVLQPAPAPVFVSGYLPPFSYGAPSGEENNNLPTTGQFSLPPSVIGLTPKLNAAGAPAGAAYLPAGQVFVPQVVPLYQDHTGAIYYPAGQAKGPESTQQNVSPGTGQKQDYSQGVDPRVYDVVGQGIGTTGNVILEAIRQGNETERARIAAQAQAGMQNAMSQSGLTEAERQQQVNAYQEILARLNAAAVQDNQPAAAAASQTGMSQSTKDMLMYGTIALVIIGGIAVAVWLFKSRTNPSRPYKRSMRNTYTPTRIRMPEMPRSYFSHGY